MTFSNRKVGGLRFIRIGRFQFSFCSVSPATDARKARAERIRTGNLPGRVYPAYTPEQAAAHREWMDVMSRS